MPLLVINVPEAPVFLVPTGGFRIPRRQSMRSDEPLGSTVVQRRCGRLSNVCNDRGIHVHADKSSSLSLRAIRAVRQRGEAHIIAEEAHRFGSRVSGDLDELYFALPYQILAMHTLNYQSSPACRQWPLHHPHRKPSIRPLSHRTGTHIDPLGFHDVWMPVFGLTLQCLCEATMNEPWPLSTDNTLL